MIEAALDLMRVLFRGIVTDEALAVEIAHVADVAERSGHPREAAALRAVSRDHRIRVLEAQGRLAALEAEFGPLPD